MASNALLTPSIITKVTLMMLENNLVAAGKVNRSFENQFVKIGATLTVRKPNRFTVSSGPALQIQNVVEPQTSITINQQKHVDFQFSSQDLTLTIEEFSERYLKPAAAELANQVDVDVLNNYTAVNNMVGTAGVLPSGFASLALVGQRMDEGAVPQDGRVLIFNSAAYWSMASSLIGLYVQSVAEPALKGHLAKVANFDIYLDQNIPAQTVGAYAGSGVVSSAGQTGSTLVTQGWTASITGLLNVGDVFTISGVYAVNPKSRKSTGSLMNFVVTAVASSDSGGNSSISIYPSIITSGAYQTVSASPAYLAPITVKGTASTAYGQNIGFVKDAFGLVTVPLEMPQGVDWGSRKDEKGLSLRIIRSYDINNDVYPCRMDILYGTTTFYPELACRLTN